MAQVNRIYVRRPTDGLDVDQVLSANPWWRINPVVAKTEAPAPLAGAFFCAIVGARQRLATKARRCAFLSRFNCFGAKSRKRGAKRRGRRSTALIDLSSTKSCTVPGRPQRALSAL
jgi:hypothetical protein